MKKMLLAIFLLFVVASSVLAGERLYDVEFRGADIKTSIRALAKMEDLNIVLPEKLTGNVTASLQDVFLDEAIDAVLKTNGYGSIIDNNIMRVVTKEEMTALGEDLVSAAYNLQYAKALIVLPHVQSLLTQRGSAIADERTNSVHVRDTQLSISNINNLMAEIDKKDKQILIEAKIIDASTDFIRSLGIQWGVTKTGGNVQTSGVVAVGKDDQGRTLMVNTPAVGYNSGAPLGGLGLVLGSFRGVLTDVQLTMAEQKGDINILSRPSVTTLNNTPASIRSGEKLYVKTNANISIGTGSSTATAEAGTNLQEIDTGIELKVTPQVSENGTIRLDIEATESEADFTRAIDGVPTVKDNTATTSVMLMDGETTIIGGLYKLKDSKMIKGIPGMMRMPLVGNLFRQKTKTKTKSEILIFITPRLVDNTVSSLASFTEPDSNFNPNPPVVEKKKPRKRKWQ